MSGSPPAVTGATPAAGWRSLGRAWEVWLGVGLAAAVAATFLGGLLLELENRTIDLRFKSRGALPLARDIVLVVVDDPDLEKLGTWPWPREQHARLARRLKEAGARVVGYDIYFNEPSRYNGPDDTQDDDAFAKAIAETGNVLLPVVFERKQVWDNDLMDTVDRPVAERPIAELRQVAAGEGFIDMEFQKMNPDGVLRYVLLQNSSEGETFFPFGLQLAAKFLGQPIATGPAGVRLGGRVLPTYGLPQWGGGEPVRGFQINYANQTGFFEEVPYFNVLVGSFPAGLFQGKAVMVGTRSKGTSEDRKFCPFGVLAGMEVHAHLFQTIVSGRTFARLGPAWFALALLVLAGVVAAVLALWTGWMGNLAVLAVFVAWVVGADLAFRREVVLEVVPVLILLPVQWALTRLIQQFVTLRQRNRDLALLNADLQRKNRELSILNEISKAIVFMDNLVKTLDAILRRAVEVLGAERGALLMLDERYENLVEEAVVVGPEGKAEVPAALKDMAARVVEQGSSLLISEVGKDETYAAMARAAEPVRSVICLPLMVHQTPIGVMTILNKQAGTFDADDLKLADIMANQAAIVIEQARLYNLATIDGLTGLIVHRHFQSKIEEEFRRAKRYDKPLSIIMTDIDHFKKFNDTWGHQTGDLVLREVAKCVRMSIRDTDVAARYGGEEFAVILPETDVEGAAQFAERLRQKVESAVCQGPKGPLSVTISLGVSSVPHNSVETTQEMIKAADEALYAAKHSGRNRFQVAPPAEKKE
ncbi:MAG: diguanylate cyclase [Candidatus Riflebacteria bacterium]|nr:diguanylate cyclase [Candidatus Riflebacteria bacterium]